MLHTQIHTKQTGMYFIYAHIYVSTLDRSDEKIAGLLPLVRCCAPIPLNLPGIEIPTAKLVKQKVLRSLTGNVHSIRQITTHY